VDGLYLPGLEEVAREQGYYEQDDDDGQRPGREYFLLAGFWLVCIGALESGRGDGLVGTDRRGLRRQHRAL
jgi:hypothetical protein